MLLQHQRGVAAVGRAAAGSQQQQQQQVQVPQQQRQRPLTRQQQQQPQLHRRRLGVVTHAAAAAAVAAPRCCPQPQQQPQLQPRQQRRRQQHAARLLPARADKGKACIVSVDPLEPIHIQCDGPTCRIPIVLTALGAIAAAYWFKRQAQEPRKKLPEPWPELPLPDADPVAYQRALARQRQAQCVQRAIGFMRAGEPSRALVELHRALDENSVCRSPLLDGHQTREELAGLYKLHIQNTQVPPNFAVLLQLRALMGLGGDEAEALEEEALHEAQAFSI